MKRFKLGISGGAVAALAIAPLASPLAAQGQSIEFGENNSDWANDGECDDPRFEGPGMATTLVDSDLFADSADCRALFANGSIRLRSDQINFGDNTSAWANDSECDDPRFSGAGMASTLLDEDRLHDANDCRSLYEAGRIQLRTTNSSINFGNDSSAWANDGECDDPRFTGPGMASTLLDEDRMHDASDCRALFQAGKVRLR